MVVTALGSRQHLRLCPSEQADAPSHTWTALATGLHAERCACFLCCSLQGLSVFMSHLETPSGTLASPFADYQDVLPLGISNLLLHLLPPCLVYGLVATLCAKAQCSKPRVVCAAAGILASYILASGLHLLVHSRHRVLCGLVLPMVGAVVAAATWRRLLHHNTIKPVRTKQHHSNGHLQSSGPGAAWQKAGKGLFNGAAEVAVSPTAAYAGTAPYPRNSHTGQGNSGQWGNSTCMGQQQQQQQHSSSISSSAHTATVNGTNQESPSANSSTSSSSWHSEYAQQQQQLHSIDARSLWCQKSPLQPDGCRQLQLHGGQAFNFSGPNLVIKEGSGSHGWLGVLHNINSSSKRISNPVTGACWLVVCGAAGSGVPLGLQLASALAAAPNSMSHVTVPLALLGESAGATAALAALLLGACLLLLSVLLECWHRWGVTLYACLGRSGSCMLELFLLADATLHVQHSADCFAVHRCCLCCQLFRPADAASRGLGEHNLCQGSCSHGLEQCTASSSSCSAVGKACMGAAGPSLLCCRCVTGADGWLQHNSNVVVASSCQQAVGQEEVFRGSCHRVWCGIVDVCWPGLDVLEHTLLLALGALLPLEARPKTLTQLYCHVYIISGFERYAPSDKGLFACHTLHKNFILLSISLWALLYGDVEHGLFMSGDITWIVGTCWLVEAKHPASCSSLRLRLVVSC